MRRNFWAPQAKPLNRHNLPKNAENAADTQKDFDDVYKRNTRGKILQVAAHYTRFLILVFGNIINTLIRIRLAISVVIIVVVEFFTGFFKLTGHKCRTGRNK